MPESDTSQQEMSRILRDWNDVPLLHVLLVLLGGVSIAIAIKWIVPRLADRLPDRFRFWVLPWEPILRVLVLLSMFAYAVPFFVIPTSENLLAIFGTIAFALGFAFKDYASSLIAGVVALYERPYRNGDWVTIENTTGEVQSLDLRTVQILTPDDTVVAVPHSRIWTTAIYNANSGHRELMCVASFYLDPEHDGRTVQQKLYDVALTSPYLHIHRPILITATEEPWGTHYRLKAYPIDGRDQFRFITDLTLRGKTMLQRLQIRPATVAQSVPVGPF